MKVLFIGESFMIHTQEAKGYDVFTFDRYEEATGFIRDAIEANGVEFVHIPCHRVDMDFPATVQELAKYDVVMISDCGANTFNLPMSTFIGLQRSPNKLEMIKEYVENGGAFVMIGGYLTFQGIQARGCYRNSPIEEILPVNLLDGDDRVEKCQGITPAVVDAQHPILNGLPSKGWPHVLGYNKLIPKKEAEVPVMVGEDPLIALGTYGKGRVCAYSTDCSPHWSPTEFCKWSGYSVLWGNIVNWLTTK